MKKEQNNAVYDVLFNTVNVKLIREILERKIKLTIYKCYDFISRQLNQKEQTKMIKQQFSRVDWLKEIT